MGNMASHPYSYFLLKIPCIQIELSCFLFFLILLLILSEVNVGYDEEKGTTHSSKLRILKQKVEGRGINCDSWKPGQHDVLICPKVRCLITLGVDFQLIMILIKRKQKFPKF